MLLEIEPVANISLEALVARRKEIRERLFPSTRPLLCRPHTIHRQALWTAKALPEAPPPRCAHGLSDRPDADRISVLLDNAGPLTIRQIVRAVAHFYGMPLDEVLSADRKSRTARIRQIACYLAKALTDKSLPEIGRRIGGKDHTTVIYSLRKIQSLLKTDPSLAAEIAELRIQLTKAEAGIAQSESVGLAPQMNEKKQAESSL